MKRFLYTVFIILFTLVCVAAQSDSTNRPEVVSTVKTNPDSALKINSQNVQETKSDTSKSALENIQSIIPEGEVKEKLTDIFSLGKIIWALIFFLVSFYIIKLITTVLDKLSEKSAKYRIGLKGLIPIVRILGWALVISIVIIVIFAPPVESLVVVTGSLGIAVGFASQDIIKNIFGGIMTLFDRPFQVGDKVEIGNYYGEVKSIGLRSTRIVTPDDSVVSIPNGDIMSKAVSNSNTGEANCQVVAEFYLPSDIDLEKVRGIAIRSAQVSKYAYLNKPIAVIFKNEIHHNRSMIKMRLKAYVLDIRYEFAFMSEMTQITLRELLKNKLVSKEELHGPGLHP
jgi:small-conductance mechanosensitive channel